MYTLFQSHKKTFFGILFLMFFGVTVSFATPPTNQTLNPDCLPSDPSCVIAISGASAWGSIAGTLASQTDLQNALNAKQAIITTGTSGQYLRGDLSLATFPTLVSAFTNDLNYVTDSRSISAGTGIAGGGDLSSNRTLSLDINSLVSKNSALMADTIPVYDSATSSIKKISRSDFLQGITGAIIYLGSYNAATNTPTITDASGSAGHEYVVTVAGTRNFGSGNITMGIGDFLIHNGSIWQLAPSSSAVSGVFGRTGSITAQAGDYTTTEVTEGSRLYFTNDRAISSTLTGYVSGAGSISSADTVLGAIQKINGNIGALVTGVSSVNGSTGAVSLASLTAADSTLAFSGSYNGSTARTIGLNLATANTWTGQQTFNTSAAIFGIGTITPKIYPASNSTTALQILRADGTTNILNVDTNNSRIGIGTTSPGYTLDVQGTSRFGGTSNYMSISSSGVLSFAGTGAFSGVISVANNAYAFRSSTYTNAGLYFDATNVGIAVTDYTNGAAMSKISAAPAGASSAQTNTFFNMNGGNVGIYNSSPARLFHVGNSSYSNIPILRLETSSGYCDHTPTASSETVACTSDERLKKNITDADNALSDIMQLRIRQYDFRATDQHSNYGVIAQEVLQTPLASLVHMDDSGFYKVDVIDAWRLTKAIQELDIKINAMLPTETDQSAYAKIKTFLEGIANQATAVVDTVQTHKLCVDDVCVTRDQFKQMLEHSQQGQMVTPAASTPVAPDTTIQPADTTPISEDTATLPAEIPQN